ncbi:MAG TPA: hypothetical protein VFF27_08860 [Bacteroidia bacterium]|jgi:hypothetical protein|nr:hypothetical protein [Bacteroidia bacterium]
MNNSNYKLEQSQTDSLFKNWNKATFFSLERQLESSTDTTKKSFYENRLLAFKAYLNINTLETINKNSIRYEFLTAFSPFPKDSEFYIIESNESGQKVLLRNFVLYPNRDVVKVEFYIKNGKWKKNGAFEMKKFNLSGNLKNYLTQKGFNDDDIVITKFENGRIKESEYFLFGTLATSSGIKNILDNY